MPFRTARHTAVFYRLLLLRTWHFDARPSPRCRVALEPPPRKRGKTRMTKSNPPSPSSARAPATNRRLDGRFDIWSLLRLLLLPDHDDDGRNITHRLDSISGNCQPFRYIPPVISRPSRALVAAWGGGWGGSATAALATSQHPRTHHHHHRSSCHRQHAFLIARTVCRACRTRQTRVVTLKRR